MTDIYRPPYNDPINNWAVFWTLAATPRIGSMQDAQNHIRPILEQCLPDLGWDNYNAYAKCIANQQHHVGVYIIYNESMIGSYDHATFVVLPGAKDQLRVLIMPPIDWYIA